MKRFLGAFALVVSFACAGTVAIPPVPPALPVQTFADFDFVACRTVPVNNYCDGVPHALFELNSGPGQFITVTSNENGYAVFQHIPIDGEGAIRNTYIQMSAAGYKPFVYNTTVADLVATNARGVHNMVGMDRERVVLPGLRAEGNHFRLENGGRITLIGASDFHLLGRFLNGEDITPVLVQRQAAGFNILRVWTRYQLSQYGIGDSTLAMHPDLYDRIPAFLDLASRHGFYIEFTAYTGREDFDPTHWERLIAAVRGHASQVLLELVNENDQSGNHIDTTPFRKPDGILASHGSNGAEKWPDMPYWDYLDFHTNGANEEQRKIGHNAMEIWGGTTYTNETSRYPDVGMWRGASVERASQLAFDSGAGAALLAGGALFHNTNGKESTLWGADALAVAKAFAAGLLSVDLACQDGPYRHPGESNGELRVYDRPVPGHDCVVKIRP